MRKQHPALLDQFQATAICGNDILSSCLYVSGIAILFSGVFAPLVLLAIACVLFLYKSVYTEVVEALPLNGGVYNCLLNGTQKIVAALAGIITFLSYIATAVISARVAISYLHTVVPIPEIPSTIALLGIFALLLLAGIKDSARVASGIFAIHIISLVTILGCGYLFYKNGHSFFLHNLSATIEMVKSNGGIANVLLLAFSASLLGVSGFESSANFVEEQKTGVFRKTLRNMFLGVAIFNPLIALVALNSLPIADIIATKDFLLSHTANTLGGPIFQYAIVIDAFLVLSGAVLTSFVGVSGLLSRMAGDSCLPNAFAKQNKNGSYPHIVILFFLLCSSILALTRGNLLSLAGVYAIAFLSVMSLFALGNLILKITRRELKRTYVASIITVLIAFAATAVGVYGNVRIDPLSLAYFTLYFLPFAGIVISVIYLDYILRFFLAVTTHANWLHRYVRDHFDDITKGKFIAFINHLDKLYPILRYINRNETGREVVIVHCKEGRQRHDEHCAEIEKAIEYLQKSGVLTHLHIESMCVHKPFSPAVVAVVSKDLHIRPNRIFIGSIHSFHSFAYEELRGVRIIS